jgi:hypothetical protein
MSPRPDKAKEQLRQENRWWQKRYRRLQKRTDRLKREVKELKEQQRRLQLEIGEYRAKLYKAKTRPAPEEAQAPRPPKKQGAPKGHPGWSRPVPRHADRHVEVTVEQCPECGSRHLKACKRHEDHYREDIVLPQVEVTRFRKHFYYCRNCGEVVSGVGEGELPGSYIGPVAKSVASFLHFQMKAPYRKLRILFRDLFHLSFTPSAAPGFDGQIQRRGAPLYEQMRQRLPAEPVAHVDETGWRKEGVIAKLSAMWRQLVTCLEVPGVCAHNNLVERLLRDNVIPRKITFGNRSDKGVENHQVLMSLIQTARLQNLNPLTLLFQLLTHPETVAATLFPPAPATSTG